MNIKEVYMSLPYDLSGSISKNRFRLEMLWGISKMFDLYEKEEFSIVFDLVCDIEIHLNNSLEFYQIKTHKVQLPYNLNVLCKPDKDTNKSILGKLFMIRNDSNINNQVKLAVVSNSYLKIGKKVYSDIKELKVTNLDKEIIDDIKNKLSIELKKDVDISNFQYIYTSMDLFNPENDIKGKITGCFEKIKKCEPKKPNALYRLIFDTVKEKASYELRPDEYDEIIKKKGITKLELDYMLNKYMDNIDISVEKTKKYIEKNPNIVYRKKMKNALVKVFGYLGSSKILQEKEIDIKNYLNNTCDVLPKDYESLIDFLLNKFQSTFPIEYEKHEIYALIILIVNRWEDEIYE